ncbi:MAG: hypothetical protein IJG82_04645 [Atopobiaceae bacterium]|nr:hypothetical protein [Atopobiaceae bacterium]
MASKIPYNKVLDVLKAGREAGRSAEETVSVIILLGEDADIDQIDTLRGAFLAEKVGGLVSVRPLSDPTAPDAPYDIAFILPGTQTADLMRAVVQLGGRGIPVAIIVRSAVESYDFSHLGFQDWEPEVIAATDGETLLTRLAEWIIRARPDKARAFSANFAFIRPIQVRALITACAIQNATVGAINLIPGSDLPIMTAHQAKLALDIAASYGKGLSAGRIPEVAGVVGAGFAYRALARTLLGLIPGVGWVLRAGLGFAGTVATGNAIKARFEAALPRESDETALAVRPQSIEPAEPGIER